MGRIWRQVRFGILFVRRFLEKYYPYIFLGLILGFILFRSSFSLKSLWAERNPAGKIGFVGNFTEATLPAEVEEKISKGLFKLDSAGVVKPVLVEDFKIKNKGKIYWLKLKKGIYWQDGSKFKAKDIYYNFKSVEKKVIGDYEIEFELEEAYGPFLTLLTRPLFKTKRLIGLGDYKVVDIKKSGKFINELAIEKHDKKKDDKKNNLGYERIKYHFYPSSEALVSGFKLGEVDEASGLTLIYDLEHWPNVKIEEEVNYNWWVGVFFNFRSSILSEKSVRQALFYALESFKIDEPKVYSPINIGSWAYTKNVKSYSFSPADADRLVSKIGKDKLRKIKITLVAVKPYDKYLEDIAESWKKLGIQVKTHRSSIIPQNYSVLITAFKIPDDPDQYYFWHSTQAGNFINYNSPRIDKVLEDGRLEYKIRKRKDIYQDFQKYFMEEIPAAPLYYPISYRVIRE